MSSPRSSWGELDQLLRLEDPELLLAHVETMARALGLTAQLVELRRLSAQQLALRLRAFIKRHKSEERAARAEVAATRAEHAAKRVVLAVRQDHVVLDVDILLYELPLHPSKHIGFALLGAEPFYLTKSKLRQLGRTLKGRPSLTAYLDARGLHVRWCRGRGGLNLRSQLLSGAERDDVFLVRVDRPRAALAVPVVAPSVARVVAPSFARAATGAATDVVPPSTVEAPRVAAAETGVAIAPSSVRRPSRRRQPGGAWLADILVELSLLS